jgi:hypothetical protein
LGDLDWDRIIQEKVEHDFESDLGDSPSTWADLP